MGLSEGGILKDTVVFPALFEIAKSPKVIISIPMIIPKAPLSRNPETLTLFIMTFDGSNTSIK